MKDLNRILEYYLFHFLNKKTQIFAYTDDVITTWQYGYPEIQNSQIASF